MSATNYLTAADPSNYESCPMGYRCRDCGAQEYIGVAVLHSKRCDLAPRYFVLPSDQAPNNSAPRYANANAEAERSRKSAERAAAAREVGLRAAAKRGDATAQGHTDADLAAAVRTGLITESDAMNQDC